MSDPDFFLQKYGIAAARFAETGLSWKTVSLIIKDYRSLRPELDEIGRRLVDSLLTCPDVHSIKFRLKDEEHLVEKILRKLTESPHRTFTLENYKDQIKDLIGVRALHLFKEDWVRVHKFILNRWKLEEKPIAYVRSGDSEKFINYYRDNQCEIREHRFGYRSVHYRLKTAGRSASYFSEIQTRTIFEEAWGEIDHEMSYPYEQENELMTRLSLILNRLSANADELASYMRYLKQKTTAMEQRYVGTIREKDRIISSLMNKVGALEINSESKREISSDLEALANARHREVEILEDYPWLEHFMESNLFKDISEGIKKLHSSHTIGDLHISRTEVDLLVKAQRDLLRLIEQTREN